MPTVARYQSTQTVACGQQACSEVGLSKTTAQNKPQKCQSKCECLLFCLFFLRGGFQLDQVFVHRQPTNARDPIAIACVRAAWTLHLPPLSTAWAVMSTRPKQNKNKIKSINTHLVSQSFQTCNDFGNGVGRIFWFDILCAHNEAIQGSSQRVTQSSKTTRYQPFLPVKFFTAFSNTLSSFSVDRWPFRKRSCSCSKGTRKL